ncbi:Oxidoreductase swnR [Lachnellula arida]|uniref:Oxidoreductase swnR n=1 Tax=Lachnellula arida TaxID=1316785 RepID=A0A8T9BI14_9HELO|nr:Oxidoreductase swnR [Lachnellula arida]
MMRIAIAGSGGLAQIFAQYLNDTVHPFIILSREDQPALVSNGYQVAVVDYDSQDDLRYTLRGIDLVLSTVSGVPQINLIDAAAHSGVRRFVPAEFEGPPARRTGNDPLDRGKRATIDRLRHWSSHPRHRMRFTIFSCGVFYERFANGGMAALDMGASTGIQNEGSYMMNARLGTAEVVECNTSGQPVYVCLTSVYDVGRFVIAALDLGLQTWPGEFRMSGERRTVTEILQWAAAVRGSKNYNFNLNNEMLTCAVQMFSTDVIEPQDLAAHLQHATYYQDYAKVARIQELIATEQRRYDFENPNLNPLVNVQPILFWNWLSAQWGVPPAQ